MQSWIETSDILLRGAGTGVLALQFFHFIGMRSLSLQRIFAAALCFSLICYILVSSPNLQSELGSIGRALRFVPVLVPFLFWWTFLAIFDDGFRWQNWHVVPLLLIVVPVLMIERVSGAGIFRAGVAAVLYVHLLVVAVRTASVDLDESRRNFRRWFLGLSALVGLVITTVEGAIGDGPLPEIIFPLHAAALLVLSMAFALWLMPSRQGLWASGPGVAKPNVADFSAAERALLVRLNTEMDAEVWRREGLTIGQLAEELGTPEHRLRRVINHGLGYRNFTAFMNERRITAACAMLSDPALAETPILTVAFDCGYSSLGPFNRAFRTIVGESPTEFRRRKLDGTVQN